jgi:hypothetical protein
VTNCSWKAVHLDHLFIIWIDVEDNEEVMYVNIFKKSQDGQTAAIYFM